MKARPGQLLKEHLYQSSYFAERFAKSFSCGKIAQLCGWLHDIGKYSEAFQEYISKIEKGEKTHRGDVIHSLQGALSSFDLHQSIVFIDIIATIIAGHHSGLCDMLTDGERTTFQKCCSSAIKVSYEEILKNKECQEILNGLDVLGAYNEFSNILKRTKDCFFIHLLVKMIFSCLVDADRCSAAGIIPTDETPNWDKYLNMLETRIYSFPCISEMDVIKRRISESCANAGQKHPGIYTLSVPTGSGKTLSSLRFALEHAKKNHLKHVIYVIPYLSIIDQTAKVLKEDVFKEEYDNCVFEHHSNVEILGDKDNENVAIQRYDYLSSRWDSPIILTTMVQFLETIFSNKPSDLRKFHNMSDAVFVFDEIQSLPVKCIHLFNQTINFLHDFANSSFLLCTATQPQLDKIKERPLRFSNEHSIINLSAEETNAFKRVNIIDLTQKGMTFIEIASLAIEQAKKGLNTLVIMNTKKSASEVFDAIQATGFEKFFLTTNICPAHRLEILNSIRRLLKNKLGKTLLCISTQLIEAGVDVSFDCVIRAEAGFDSIIQAAGRCNRNKESTALREVFIVDAVEEKLSHLEEIGKGKTITTRVLAEYGDCNFSFQDMIDKYYNYFYSAQEISSKMSYPINEVGKSKNIYHMLDKNELEKAIYYDVHEEKYPGLPASFQTAAENFSVIEGAHIGVVVQYGEANKLVSDFQKTKDSQERFQIYKKLQKYTITVYATNEHVIQSVCSIVKDAFGRDAFYLLSKGCYNEKGFNCKQKEFLSI